MKTQGTKSETTKTSDVIHMGDATFESYLQNIAFPKSREAILQIVEENTENSMDDNQALMDRFRQLPDIVYNSMEDVRQALGEEYENYGVVKKTEEKNVQASQANRH